MATKTVTQETDWITTYTSTFPARRYQYRHYALTHNGVELEGFVQVKKIGKRVETITCFSNSCVMGAQKDWLVRMNAAEVN